MKRIRLGVPHTGRDAALVILYARLEGGMSDLSLLFEQHTFALDSREARLARAMVYGVLTRLYTIDAILNKRVRQPWSQLHPWVRTNLRLGIWQLRWSKQIPPSAVCDEACKSVSRVLFPQAVSLVNACLRNEVREPTQWSARSWDWEYSLSPELIGLFKQALGAEGAQADLSALLEVPPLTVRCQTSRNSMKELRAQLEKEGVEVEAGSFHPQALRIRLCGNRLTDLEAFQKGMFFVQGEGAMTVGSLVPLHPGQRVLDLCAAPGGKLTHLLDLQPQLEVLGRDPIPERLDQIRENLERLQLTGFSCRLECGEAESFQTDQSFNLVLADVPCSGLGLIGRKPEIRMNMQYERIQALLPIQFQILEQAAAAVEVGGFLLYSTCTLTRLENQDQVRTFLQKHSEFTPVSLLPLLPERLIERLRVDPARFRELEEGMCTFRPALCGCEGFFLALLKKAADASNG